MKTYTPRQLRSAIALAVALTILAMLAMFDPSCQPRSALSPAGPSRSIRTK